jgi:nucleoside-diphosphate-sugar epimerase
VSEIHLGNLEPRRDLTFVNDTVRAFLLAGTAPGLEGQVIHFGQGKAISVRELAERCLLTVGSQARIVSTAERTRTEKSEVDLLLVPSLRDEMLTISNQTGHPSLTLRAGFVNVSEARSDWAPDPEHPLPKFSPARRVPHGVTLLGRLFDEGTIARAGIAMEQSFGVVGEHPPGF